MCVSTDSVLGYHALFVPANFIALPRPKFCLGLDAAELTLSQKTETLIQDLPAGSQLNGYFLTLEDKVHPI